MKQIRNFLNKLHLFFVGCKFINRDFKELKQKIEDWDDEIYYKEEVFIGMTFRHLAEYQRKLKWFWIDKVVELEKQGKITKEELEEIQTQGIVYSLKHSTPEHRQKQLDRYRPERKQWYLNQLQK